jgi:hypothetical protein
VRSALLLSLLLSACVADRPTLVLDGEGCDAIDLTVLDPAILPGWIVHALVAESAEGDAVWTLATDPNGALLLKPWPDGPALDLSLVGEADDFSLIRGRSDHESWLLLDRQDHLRVWRLGRAADGEVTGSPDLSGFPGPGGWHYSLLLVGDVPYLLAAATGVQARTMRFQLAPLDPTDLSLGPAGPPLRFTDLCMPPSERPCDIFTGSPALAEVDELATTEAGAMAGAAVLLGVQFGPGVPLPSGFIHLQLDDRGAGYRRASSVECWHSWEARPRASTAGSPPTARTCSPRSPASRTPPPRRTPTTTSTSRSPIRPASPTWRTRRAATARCCSSAATSSSPT